MNGLDYFLLSFSAICWAFVAFVKYNDYLIKKNQTPKE